jgi:ATP-binding cassette subfamily F protein uup
MGKKIIEIEHLSKKFDQLVVLENFSYTFKRQDRIGIIGPNGTGKSTFLNMLTGQLSPDSGTISKGENTHVGYYTQHGMELSADMRVIDVVKEVAEVIETGTGEQITASQLLTHFQFPPRQQYTPVARLSGGEKRRLQLLRVLMSNPNFLILDEPANDLDIVTLNILEDFLEQYPGCLILVSHDRYLMDRLVDHLFVFEGNGIIRDFPGNYSDYKESLELQAAEAGTTTKKEAEKARNDKPGKAISSESPSRKLSFKEKKEFENLETEIAILESRKEALTQQLSNAASASHQQVTAWSEEIAQITALIDEKSMRWLELSELM